MTNLITELRLAHEIATHESVTADLPAAGEFGRIATHLDTSIKIADRIGRLKRVEEWNTKRERKGSHLMNLAMLLGLATSVLLLSTPIGLAIASGVGFLVCRWAQKGVQS